MRLKHRGTVVLIGVLALSPAMASIAGASPRASAASAMRAQVSATGECQPVGSGVWTQSAVQAATGAHNVVTVFNVPKKLTQCTLAFLNPGLSYPYFATLSSGMFAAAKFYGVHFVQTNLNFNYGLAAQQFRTIEPEHPAVVGVQTSNTALWSAVQSAHLPLLTVDSVQAGDPHHIGVNNVLVADEAAGMLAPAVQALLARQGAWEGKTLVYVGLSASDCPPCDQRVQAELAELRADGVSISSSNTIITETYPGGRSPTVDSAQEYFADVLTAHPDDVFVVASFGDEPVVGALQAAKAAGRLGDLLAVSLGGDSVAVAALQDATYTGVYLGAVAFNPYSEGWNWVAAALAIAEHKSYSAYQASQILTTASVG